MILAVPGSTIILMLAVVTIGVFGASKTVVVGRWAGRNEGIMFDVCNTITTYHTKNQN